MNKRQKYKKETKEERKLYYEFYEHETVSYAELKKRSKKMHMKFLEIQLKRKKNKENIMADKCRWRKL